VKTPAARSDTHDTTTTTPHAPRPINTTARRSPVRRQRRQPSPHDDRQAHDLRSTKPRRLSDRLPRSLQAWIDDGNPARRYLHARPEMIVTTRRLRRAQPHHREEIVIDSCAARRAALVMGLVRTGARAGRSARRRRTRHAAAGRARPRASRRSGVLGRAGRHGHLSHVAQSRGPGSDGGGPGRPAGALPSPDDVEGSPRTTKRTLPVDQSYPSPARRCGGPCWRLASCDAARRSAGGSHHLTRGPYCSFSPMVRSSEHHSAAASLSPGRQRSATVIQGDRHGLPIPVDSLTAGTDYALQAVRPTASGRRRVRLPDRRSNVPHTRLLIGDPAAAATIS